MMKILVLIFCFSFSAWSKNSFGEKITLKEAVTLEKALKSGISKEQLVKAKVSKVCSMSGCWMMLQDEDKTEYRVTFSDYGTKVPVSLIGKNVLVQGKINKKTLTLNQTKHYVEDEGGDPSKVTEARVEYRIVASGVEVLD